MNCEISLKSGPAEEVHLGAFQCLCLRNPSPLTFDFVRTPITCDCHPDPQAAVFRGLRRRDLLFSWIQATYGIGSSGLSVGRTCWSKVLSKIAVDA